MFHVATLCFLRWCFYVRVGTPNSRVTSAGQLNCWQLSLCVLRTMEGQSQAVSDSRPDGPKAYKQHARTVAALAFMSNLREDHAWVAAPTSSWGIAAPALTITWELPLPPLPSIHSGPILAVPEPRVRSDRQRARTTLAALRALRK